MCKLGGIPKGWMLIYKDLSGKVFVSHGATQQLAIGFLRYCRVYYYQGCSTSWCM